ncbi:MAG: ABC-type iron(III) uptake system ATPase component FbpC [Roseibaca calidilacus]|uniref:ABC-type iron(III) uptake system ATPase component FbpC n=1 Tax=Roseibaca calidilacus TaxID=1666912 RepID=A0A0P7YUK8_9RHOB|nr:ABC transporter ATP-binding protein [Roseibaca calidilacus]KPP94188.1 MAG: ABC-type iron(III) uptake system ATPase component FbpC [Roseibaca calidilacus]CUX81405.1 iron(III) transport system ATP-binding protein [Roseibaca calidilacus]
MNTLPKSLSFKMPAEATPLGFRPAPKNVILTVDRLRKRFALGDAPAVERASFELGQGEMLALLGPSGCGKTTTLRMIAGFEVPDAGHVRLRGQDITHTAPEARGIGFVFQDYALFPHLTVLDNVKFGLRNLTRAKATARAEEMLRMVGLAGLAARRPHELSGGQQQRVALARTLAMAPPLVLMDEPFSNLDAAMRVETRQEVRKLLKQTGAAGIIVTHDQEEAMAVADRIAVMEAGRIVQIGTPDEIYRYPVSAFVASFIGRSNILNGKADGMEVATEFGKLPLSRAANGAVMLSVRPEQIMLEADPDGSASVVGREFRGHDQLYWVQEGERCLQVISGAGATLDVGARVRLRICDCVVPLA